MRDDLFQKVLTKTALAILTDDSDNIIWETDKSPVSGMYRAYFKNKFSESKDMILYANQAGIAMGIMAGQIPIRECHAVKVSEYTTFMCFPFTLISAMLRTRQRH